MSDDITQSWRDEWKQETWRSGHRKPSPTPEQAAKPPRQPAENGELRWNWDGSRARDLGATGGMHTESHGPGDGDEMRCKAAARARRIDEALRDLSKEQADALRDCYSPPPGAFSQCALWGVRDGSNPYGMTRNDVREADRASKMYAYDEDSWEKWGQPVARLLSKEKLRLGKLGPADVTALVRLASAAHDAFADALARHDRVERVEFDESQVRGQWRNACRLGRMRAQKITRAMRARDRVVRAARWIADRVGAKGTK